MMGVNGCGGEIGGEGDCASVNSAEKTRIAAATAVEIVRVENLKSVNSLRALSLDDPMQEVKERHSYKNDNRDRWVSFFFVIDFGNQVTRGYVKRNTCRKR